VRFVAFFVTVVVALALASVPIPRAAAQIPEGWEIVEIFPAGTEFHPIADPTAPSRFARSS